MGIFQDIKSSFKKGSYLTQLIYINIAVFLLVTLVSVFSFFGGYGGGNLLTDFLALPAYLPNLWYRVWTPITYMFLHEQFIHLLFNLLWLYWFGQIFLQYFEQKHLLSVYLSGGLVGGLLYMLAYNMFPVFENALPIAYALGASASVYAIVFATATYVPDLEIRLAFLGHVKLKYLAMILIGLDLISIPSMNAGGHIAHLGGALFGFWFAYEYKKGRLLTKRMESWLEVFFTLFKRKPKMKVTYKKTGNVDYDYQNKKASQQKQINEILDKISKSGYSSLSQKEKEMLFKMSDKK